MWSLGAIVSAERVSEYSCAVQGCPSDGNACAGVADMRYRRARYRLLAVVMLAIGLVMMASSAAPTLIVVQMLLAILCAVVSLRVRDYS